MLYTNIQLEAFLEKIFKCFYNISCITDRDHLYKPFQSPINRRLQEKLEDNLPREIRGEFVQRCGQTDGRRTKSDYNSSSWAFGELKTRSIYACKIFLSVCLSDLVPLEQPFCSPVISGINLNFIRTAILGNGSFPQVNFKLGLPELLLEHILKCYHLFVSWLLSVLEARSYVNLTLETTSSDVLMRQSLSLPHWSTRRNSFVSFLGTHLFKACLVIIWGILGMPNR